MTFFQRLKFALRILAGRIHHLEWSMMMSLFTRIEALEASLAALTAAGTTNTAAADQAKQAIDAVTALEPRVATLESEVGTATPAA